MRARPPLRVPRRRAVRVSARAWIVMFTCCHVHLYSCCHVYLLSCLYVVGRHSLGTTVLTQKGACNQGRKVEDFYSGDVTRRHSLGECVLTTLLKSTFKKKELPYESFSTFLCQTLKRIYPRIVEDNWKRSKCRITTQPVFFHKPMKEYQQA